jgi:hypothetical protein
MESSDYPIVYEDTQFGMHDDKSLSIWVNCYLNGQKSDAC